MIDFDGRVRLGRREGGYGPPRSPSYGHALWFATMLFFLPQSAPAGSVSATFQVTARVVVGCRIQASAEGLAGPAPRLAWGSVAPAAGTRLSADCGRLAERPPTMAIRTESSRSATPIFEIIDDETSGRRRHGHARVIDGSADSRIIHWGLFSIDDRFVISMPEPAHAVEPVPASDRTAVIMLAIDF